jgi:hypothetical protein
MNALAHFAWSSVSKKKSFLTLAPGGEEERRAFAGATKKVVITRVSGHHPDEIRSSGNHPGPCRMVQYSDRPNGLKCC